MGDLTGCHWIRQSLGVYVLGAIDPAERVQVESHLAGCPACREELAGLAGLPALLDLVPASEAEQILGSGSASERITPDDDSASELPSLLLARMARQRRVRTWRGVAAAAAAVVAVAAGTAGVVVAEHTPPRPAAIDWETAQATTSGVSLEVRYAGASRGTRLDARVSGIPEGTTCQFWVTGAGGSRWAAGRWTVNQSDWDAWFPESAAVPLSAVRGFQLTEGGRILVSVPANRA